jgi:hypothetical protein
MLLGVRLADMGVGREMGVERIPEHGPETNDHAHVSASFRRFRKAVESLSLRPSSSDKT